MEDFNALIERTRTARQPVVRLVEQRHDTFCTLLICGSQAQRASDQLLVAQALRVRLLKPGITKLIALALYQQEMFGHVRLQAHILLHIRRRSMLRGPNEGNFAIWKAVFYANGTSTALGKSLGRLAKWKIPHHLPSPHHAGDYREEKAHHGSIQPRRLGGAHAVAL